MSVHFSSKSSEWGTPCSLFNYLNASFKFTLDVCASEENAKCKNFFSLEEDGLNQAWSGVCWMNPPYGREIGKWMRKAWMESRLGVTVVCLVPARTDTKWWHDYATKGSVTFIEGRLKFNKHKNSAPFPSAIILFQKVGSWKIGAIKVQALK